MVFFCVVDTSGAITMTVVWTGPRELEPWWVVRRETL